MKILYIQKILRGFYFHESSHTRRFVKIKSSRNGEITSTFLLMKVNHAPVTNIKCHKYDRQTHTQNNTDDEFDLDTGN